MHSSLHMRSLFSFFFFFNDTATTEIYTFSLHDALPIYDGRQSRARYSAVGRKPNSGQKNFTVAPLPCALQSGPKYSRLLRSEDRLQRWQIGVDFLALQGLPFRSKQVLSCFICQQNVASRVNCDDRSWTAFDEGAQLLLGILA